MRATLFGKEGDRTFAYEITKPQTVIGRGTGCDIVIRDSSTSRRHMTIERDADGGYVARDLGSRNGTIINGRKITDKRLEWGDRITIGAMSLLFVPREERGAARELPGERPQRKTLGINVHPPDMSRVKEPRREHLRLLLEMGQPGAELLEAIVKTLPAAHAAIARCGTGAQASVVERCVPEGARVQPEEELMRLVRATGKAFLREGEPSTAYVPVRTGGSVEMLVYVAGTTERPIVEDDLWVLAAAVQMAGTRAGTGGT